MEFNLSQCWMTWLAQKICVSCILQMIKFMGFNIKKIHADYAHLNQAHKYFIYENWKKKKKMLPK